MPKDYLKIADHKFSSRLILGTGKFPSKKIMAKALNKSGAEIVTAAVRRANLQNSQDSLFNFIDPKKYLILPNTSGARNAKEAIRLAELARATGVSNWIKVEVIPDQKYLLPDASETLKTVEKLVKLGFIVLPYINADPVLAKKCEDLGAAAVMPLASPIGSNRGIKTKEMLEIIIRESLVPVIIDAGIGKPSDASLAMEMGADAVMINTAIAIASDPVIMADAFKLAVMAGRAAFLAGLAETSFFANASSPKEGLIEFS